MRSQNFSPRSNQFLMNADLKAPQLLDAGTGQQPFDVTIQAAPLNEIVGGGPARDAVRALDHPKFVSSKEADRFLRSKDRILGVTVNGVANIRSRF
jgi:hypothetical protein